MRLYELFEEAEDGMIAQLRQHVMDHVLPMISHDVESVPIQDIQDKLTNMKTGLVIDRALVQQILDPTKLQMIKKVEGDRVYFNIKPEVDVPTANAAEQERRQDRLKGKATDEAKAKIKDRIEANVGKRVQKILQKKKAR
jgi:hypothetical protein